MGSTKPRADGEILGTPSSAAKRSWARLGACRLTARGVGAGEPAADASAPPAAAAGAAAGGGRPATPAPTRAPDGEGPGGWGARRPARGGPPPLPQGEGQPIKHPSQS